MRRAIAVEVLTLLLAMLCYLDRVVTLVRDTTSLSMLTGIAIAVVVVVGDAMPTMRIGVTYVG
ncbi:hypothetical protein JK358_35520 [Nocardia sp. 2]|uniref:Uncharacterized protein n=1 Tax=Nocardia acididurans TaxID=2802282 RepID=A0ABS1MGD8_9NOCA|nr:hypothetical protein [Nocardia acididurans]MBL1079726.1 hypothetical protein [Nocardia acididurans]